MTRSLEQQLADYGQHLQNLVDDLVLAEELLERPVETDTVRPLDVPVRHRRRNRLAAAGAAIVVLILIGGIGLLIQRSVEEEAPVITQAPVPTVPEPSPTLPTTETTLPVEPAPAIGGSWRAVEGQVHVWSRSIWIDVGAAYDAGSDLVVTGGAGQVQLWFDANTDQWTSSDDGADPRAQAYDPIGDRVIAVTNEGETFAFDVDTNTWTDLAPTESFSPGRRNGQAMVYDTESEKAVMFGGGELTVVFENHGVAQALGDTWTYDPTENAWNEPQAGPSPPPRVWPTMVYDSGSDRVVLFGGAELAAGATLTSGGIVPESWRGVYGDTWIYDTNTATWTEMQPPVSPPARAQAVMWYDTDADQVFLYGGTSRVADTPLSSEMFGGEELWAYDLDTDTWTLYQVESPNPGLLVSAEAAFDIESGVAVVFDGHRKTEAGRLVENTQTWIYEHSEGQTPDS